MEMMSRAKKLAHRKAWRVRSAEKTSDRFPHSRNHLSCCGVLVSRSVFFGCIDFSFMSGSWATAEGSVLREDVSTVPVERTLKSTKESLCHECAAVHTIENHEGSISECYFCTFTLADIILNWKDQEDMTWGSGKFHCCFLLWQR